MLFSRARDSNENLDITTLFGSNIDCVSECKYLGVWLDNKLTFKCHIENLTVKLQQKIGDLNLSAFIPFGHFRNIILNSPLPD